MFSFPQISPSKSYMHLSSSAYLLHAPPIPFILIWSPEWYLVRSTNQKASRYVVFSVPLTSSLLGPNTLFRTLFFKTTSLRFSLIVSDQVSYPDTTTGTIIVLYVLIIIDRWRKGGNKRVQRLPMEKSCGKWHLLDRDMDGRKLFYGS